MCLMTILLIRGRYDDAGWKLGCWVVFFSLFGPLICNIGMKRREQHQFKEIQP